MPIPEKKTNESRGEFLMRCMQDHTMIKEYPEQDQRYAVCIAQWES